MSNPVPGQTGVSVGIIVGGTIGAVVAVALLVCFLLLYRRRRVAVRSETLSAVDSLMEVSQPPKAPSKYPTNHTSTQVLVSPMSQSTYGPTLDDDQYIQVNYPPTDLEAGRSQHQKHHLDHTPIAELEGSTRFLYTPGQQYHELDSRPLPRVALPVLSRPAQHLPGEVT
ncbi:hypothetical protein F5Y04DRAFT_143410 [Hypomontagnella monticulosa]|nr:hypothetical protein F5Y04DRAFT_143410 [Hypomontagnella monticulosa]